jgi:hypothetical protein
MQCRTEISGAFRFFAARSGGQVKGKVTFCVSVMGPQESKLDATKLYVKVP